jgi:hypothetical protein
MLALAPAVTMFSLVMKRYAFLLALLVAASPAVAQQRAEGKGQGKWQGTSKAERQQMRDDMRQAYKERGQQPDKAARQERRQLSPEQREGLRRDMQDANRNLKKR